MSNLRETAEEIVRGWTIDDGDDALMSAIEAALVAEREKAVKACKYYFDCAEKIMLESDYRQYGPQYWSGRQDAAEGIASEILGDAWNQKEFQSPPASAIREDT